MNSWLYGVFIALWVFTFVPAWKMLIKLVALSVSEKPLNLHFLSLFIVYRAIILLPYLVLLVFGQNLPNLLVDIVIGIIVLGLVLSIIRFFLRDWAISLLWNIYSYVYDGLLMFYPYNHLLELVAKRVVPSDNSSILDVGTGTGNLALKLAKRFPNAQITCIDASTKMTKKAARKLKAFNGVIVERSSVTEYFDSNPEKKFDVIILSNVLYAIDDRRRFWRDGLGHLHKKGHMIITNSDRGGSWPIIKEHLRNESWVKLLHPKLIGVFIIDLFIGQLAAAEKFSFLSLQDVKKEIARAGGTVQDIERCYGGEKQGVNLLFTVTSNR